MSFLPLLLPLRWTGFFLPLLPAHLLEALQAPVPLIAGIHALPPGIESADDVEQDNILFWFPSKNELWPPRAFQSALFAPLPASLSPPASAAASASSSAFSFSSQPSSIEAMYTPLAHSRLPCTPSTLQPFLDLIAAHHDPSLRHFSCNEGVGEEKEKEKEKSEVKKNLPSRFSAVLKDSMSKTAGKKNIGTGFFEGLVTSFAAGKGRGETKAKSKSNGAQALVKKSLAYRFEATTAVHSAVIDILRQVHALLDFLLNRAAEMEMEERGETGERGGRKRGEVLEGEGEGDGLSEILRHTQMFSYYVQQQQELQALTSPSPSPPLSSQI